VEERGADAVRFSSNREKKVCWRQAHFTQLEIREHNAVVLDVSRTDPSYEEKDSQSEWLFNQRFSLQCKGPEWK